MTSELALRTTEQWSAGSALVGALLAVVLLTLVARAVWRSARGSARR